MRPLLALVALCACFGLAACAHASKSSSAAPQTPADTTSVGVLTKTGSSSSGRSLLGDGDADNPRDIDGDEHPDNDRDDDSRTRESYNYHDRDDGMILSFGRAASGAEKRAIAAVVVRYYRAAATSDGAAACSLLTHALAVAAPEDYGGPGGPAYLRGDKTCETLVSALFEHSHNQLTGAIKVTGVRVRDGIAEALLGSPTMPASEIMLRHEAGTWRIVALLGSTLP